MITNRLECKAYLYSNYVLEVSSFPWGFLDLNGETRDDIQCCPLEWFGELLLWFSSPSSTSLLVCLTLLLCTIFWFSDKLSITNNHCNCKYDFYVIMRHHTLYHSKVFWDQHKWRYSLISKFISSLLKNDFLGRADEEGWEVGLWHTYKGW